MSKKVDRVIIFSQSNDRMAHILLRAYFEAFVHQQEMKLVAVCLPRPHRNGPLVYRYLRDIVSRTLRLLFDRREKNRPGIPRPVFIDRWAKKLGFSIIVPPDADINSPDFLATLRTEFEPTVAISCVCLEKFSPELLATFDYAVNYHNGLLPHYKGIKATAWSLYNNEQTSGFTFHRMNEFLDEGEILIQEALPVCPELNTIDLDLLKARQAAEVVPDSLEMILRREPGTQQAGQGSYYSKRDKLNIQKITDSTEVSSEELIQRLRAFGDVQVQIDGHWYTVTKLAGPLRKIGNRQKWIIQTSDGKYFRPTRINFLPTRLYTIRRYVKNLFG